MDKNEIKKILYKEASTAIKALETDQYSLYITETSLGQVEFKIPIEENEKFSDQLKACLLIRWMV